MRHIKVNPQAVSRDRGSRESSRSEQVSFWSSLKHSCSFWGQLKKICRSQSRQPPPSPHLLPHPSPTPWLHCRTQPTPGSCLYLAKLHIADFPHKDRCLYPLAAPKASLTLFLVSFAYLLCSHVGHPLLCLHRCGGSAGQDSLWLSQWASVLFLAHRSSELSQAF